LTKIIQELNKKSKKWKWGKETNKKLNILNEEKFDFFCDPRKMI
jgi:hypothetical protein